MLWGSAGTESEENALRGTKPARHPRLTGTSDASEAAVRGSVPETGTARITTVCGWLPGQYPIRRTVPPKSR
jgi:hypothetical protein